MHRVPTAPPTTALAAVLVAALWPTAPGPARAAEPEILPSGICQAPSYEVFLAGKRGTDVNAASGAAAAEWERVFQAVLARCRKSDVLALTLHAQASALRLCDWDRPVHFPPSGGVICTYAGGTRETR